MVMTRWFSILVFAASVAGCSSSGGSECVEAPSSCPSEVPSYKTDVAPLFQKYCVSCHVAGGVQPDPLLDTHAGVAAEAGEVKEQIASCAMPQAGSAQPTDAERETLLAWLVCGAPDN